MKKYKGICTPKGFVAGGIASGIKKKGLDLALIYSASPCKAQAVMTKNMVLAAPNIVTKKKLSKSKNMHAVLINSGNANCLMGKKGIMDAEELCGLVAEKLRINKNSVLCASTGIIGKKLPLAKMKRAVPPLVNKINVDGGISAARAILTTDKFSKSKSVTFKIKGVPVKIGAIAKGAGMIEPNLATMLCFVSTDANISAGILKRALTEATNSSFNCISIDGQMSTNDMVLILANGLANNAVISNTDSVGYKTFKNALYEVLGHLAKQIVADAEGGSKIIEINIKNTKSESDAKIVARSIANSALVKTAMYGEDPNFGRIMAAVGSSPGTKLKLNKIKLFIQGICVVKNSDICSFDLKKLRAKLRKKEINITIDLEQGASSFTMLTSDLTKEYVRLNSAYST